jgi:hypothetical protein
MDGPEEYALVVKALICGLSNCVEWKDARTTLRIRDNPALRGLTPTAIKHETIAFVNGGGQVKQVVENRPDYKGQYDFYYKVVLPLDDFPRGLFVEMVPVDEDPDCPCVALVNSHPQQR